MVGRTHLQAATPLTLGQLISGWVARLDQALDGIRQTLPGVFALAIGGTAVGTGSMPTLVLVSWPHGESPKRPGAHLSQLPTNLPHFRLMKVW
jgi:hypothetical protein